VRRFDSASAPGPLSRPRSSDYQFADVPGADLYRSWRVIAERRRHQLIVRESKYSIARRLPVLISAMIEFRSDLGDAAVNREHRPVDRHAGVKQPLRLLYIPWPGAHA
jgi:hypothetical protein